MTEREYGCVVDEACAFETDSWREMEEHMAPPHQTIVKITLNIENEVGIWVVSWVYWNGDEQGGGGFNWYTDHEAARRGFEHEKSAWNGGTARIRLVRVPNQAITDWLDSDIDMVEVKWPAEAVALVCDEAVPA